MDKNKIMVFENALFGSVRTLCIEGAPWFVAADVCKSLDIGNPRQAVSRLDDDEKMNTVIISDGHSFSKQISYINERQLSFAAGYTSFAP